MATDQQTESQEQGRQQSTLSNQIKLVPYVQIDGEWILSEEFLDSVFDKLVSQGLLKTTFWEGKITDQSHFVGLAQNPGNHMVFFFEETNCVGFAWLSSVSANFAFVHFCLFKDVWGSAVEVGLNCVDYWFSWPGSDGTRLLDVLIGIMPGFNHRAHRYVEKLGWTHLGKIPNMFKDTEGNREDAIIYYTSR